MLKISEAEKIYIRDGFRQKIRSDGRGNTDIRDVWLEMGTLKHANGSCTFFDADTNNKIHVGIKIELGQPEKNSPEEGIIKILVDSSQRKSFESAEMRELNDTHDDVQYLLDKFMISPLDKKGLCHVPGRVCWIINIDVFCLSHLRAIDLDRISLAVRAALVNLEIPELIVTQNQITSEYEVDIVEDKIKKISDFLDINTIPIICTIGEVEKFLIVDLNDEEYQCLDSRYVVSVDLKGEIYGINKIGSGGILFGEFPMVLKLAKTTTYELIKNQNKYLNQ